MGLVSALCCKTGCTQCPRGYVFCTVLECKQRASSVQAACNCRCDIQGLSRLKATKSAMRNSARLPWNRGRCSVLIRKPVSQPSPELKLEAQQTKQRALFNMAVNDLHLHPQAVPGFASPDACTCTVRLLHVCMHVPLYLEIAAAPPPTRGPSDMTRHGVNSRGKCHLLPPPFHLIPCRRGGEKDFAYITATTMGLAAIRIGTGTGRANNSCEKRLGLLFGPPAIASVSNVQVKSPYMRPGSRYATRIWRWRAKST
jgi:hypothetical protein